MLNEAQQSRRAGLTLPATPARRRIAHTGIRTVPTGEGRAEAVRARAGISGMLDNTTPKLSNARIAGVASF